MVYNNQRVTQDLHPSIKDIATNPCKKCNKELHYPSQLHTVWDGHVCCKCLGHEYGDCFNQYTIRG